MAVSYPDVIGEHTSDPVRFVNDGLQYTGYFEPSVIAPGQSANLYLFLQSVFNVPLTAKIKVEPPKTGFLSGKKPILEVDRPEVEIQFGPGEAGLLTLPVVAPGNAKKGDHSLTLEVKASAKGRAERVRPAKFQSKLDTKLIDDPVGLNLTASLGATYSEKSAKRADFGLTISGPAIPPDRAPNLKFRYDQIWSVKDAETFNKAIREINSRQVKIKQELTPEALYANFFGETVKRFGNVGLPLRIGEAIMLAKIVTFTCQYFLDNPNLAPGVLVPIWERAYELDADTTHAMQLIRTVGFHHLIRLSVATSFGVIAQTTGKQLWELEERQAVASHVADSLEMGESLDLDFLYLPLLMAGTRLSARLKMPDEDPAHSVALMRQARLARTDLFTDQEMKTANHLYNQILQKAAS
ncbi:MAG TPA: hypothetical protein PKD98_18620 [Anaerolineae bacterium]|nr:hypothetical protein [Anaerolineae bacterium]